MDSYPFVELVTLIVVIVSIGSSIIKLYCECFRTLPGSYELLTLATDS